MVDSHKGFDTWSEKWDKTQENVRNEEENMEVFFVVYMFVCIGEIVFCLNLDSPRSCSLPISGVLRP